MRWFRNNPRTGSWLALLALAINFALSFGHLHLNGVGADRGTPSLAAFAAVSHDGQPADQGNHPDDLCPICIAAAAVGTAVAAAPPALPTVFNFVALDRTIERQLSVPQSSRRAFQSRGPPAA